MVVSEAQFTEYVVNKAFSSSKFLFFPRRVNEAHKSGLIWKTTESIDMVSTASLFVSLIVKDDIHLCQSGKTNIRLTASDLSCCLNVLECS